MGTLFHLNFTILSGMCTSVVFRSVFGLPRSADTEIDQQQSILINKPKQNLQNKRHRKHFYHVFQMGKTHSNADRYWSR